MIKCVKMVVCYFGFLLVYSFLEVGYVKLVMVVEVKLGGEVKWEEIFLFFGKLFVKWKVQGLSEVYGWFDEGCDWNVWIDFDIYLMDQFFFEEIYWLRKVYLGFIYIRLVFEEKEIDIDWIEVKNILIEDWFKKFYEK